MPRAFLVKNKTFLKQKDSKKIELNAKDISISLEDINQAIDRLNLRTQKIDEIDIYNLIEYLLLQKSKESK